MSTNPFYTPTGNPQQLSRGASALIRAEFQAIANAFSMIASATGYNSGVDTGAPNAYVVTPVPALTSVQQFSQLLVLVGLANTNTGAAAVTVNGLGPFNITRRDGSALQAGDIPGGSVVLLYFDGAEYQLQGNALAGNATAAINMNGNTLNLARSSAVPSAATLNLDGVKGNSGSITGTTNITAVTLAAGHMYFGTFAGSLTLTNSAGLALPGNANITTQAGDMALFVGTGSGNVVVFYMPISGLPVVAPTVGLTKIASSTFSGVAAINYLSLFSSAYDDYQIVVENFQGDATGSLQMQIAVAGVAYTTSYQYAGNSALFTSSASNTPYGSASSPLLAVTLSALNSSTSAAGISILLTGANSATVSKNILSNASYILSASGPKADYAACVINPSAVCTGFLLKLSSGGNMSGTIKVYGFQN